ncbi:hypothetical protein [Streptomyces sp. NPDC048349]|uniref:hypothetical protein n=1 Tax=Streptomyces sp. NPDC048349 TaxID=3155486 RepID=UPI00344ADC60
MKEPGSANRNRFADMADATGADRQGGRLLRRRVVRSETYDETYDEAFGRDSLRGEPAGAG